MQFKIEEDGPNLAETPSLGKTCSDCGFIVWVDFCDENDPDDVFDLAASRVDIIEGVKRRLFNRSHDCAK